MLTLDLLMRSLNQTSSLHLAQTQRERLLHALQPAPYVSFDAYTTVTPAASNVPVSGSTQSGQSWLNNYTGAGRRGEGESDGNGEADGNVKVKYAHKNGVNTLTVDRFEGRYLLSGGSDGSISIWDLEASLSSPSLSSASLSKSETIVPLGTVSKGKPNHTYGVTHVSFYPFDSLAFLSSSYDHTLKIFSSETLAPAASFDLSSVVYSHAVSPIATHLLAACASQHPAIRLVDLRSGASTHTLTGHVGAGVFSVAWSPKDESILASGGADGTVRFWDVRRSAGMLACLDKEDSVGVVAGDSVISNSYTDRKKAHDGSVNGVVWTDDGKFVVTAGHDERVRVWNTFSGANTLANFGPLLRNTLPSTLLPCLTPSGVTPLLQDVMIYPNEKEIMMYDLFEGRLIKRLKIPNTVAASSILSQRSESSSRSPRRNRVNALAWKYHDVELFSAHNDGTIRSWKPRTTIDAMADEQEKAEAEGREDSDVRKRKRQVLEDIYRDLMAPKITYP